MGKTAAPLPGRMCRFLSVERQVDSCQARNALAMLHFTQRSCRNNAKSHGFPWLFALLVGRARFELATNGLKVRCSTG
jgi:hypothetical protein